MKKLILAAFCIEPNLTMVDGVRFCFVTVNEILDRIPPDR